MHTENCLKKIGRVYDERAALVLKSFEWKRKDEDRKEVFEKIYIGC